MMYVVLQISVSRDFVQNSHRGLLVFVLFFNVGRRDSYLRVLFRFSLFSVALTCAPSCILLPPPCYC
jgi:hypothetical protein